MGRVKGLLEIAGERMIVRTARTIEPLVADVTIVGSPELYAGIDLRAICDQDVRAGERMESARTPLVGVATALHATNLPWNLILACDLPYLTAEWVDWLLARAVASRSQIVMPRSSAGLEPLAAVYRRECAAPVLASIERGVRKVTDALAELQMEQIAESEWREHDLRGEVLKNMNTPHDFEEAKKILER